MFKKKKKDTRTEKQQVEHLAAELFLSEIASFGALSDSERDMLLTPDPDGDARNNHDELVKRLRALVRDPSTPPSTAQRLHGTARELASEGTLALCHVLDKTFPKEFRLEVGDNPIADYTEMLHDDDDSDDGMPTVEGDFDEFDGSFKDAGIEDYTFADDEDDSGSDDPLFSTQDDDGFPDLDDVPAPPRPPVPAPNVNADSDDDDMFTDFEDLVDMSSLDDMYDDEPEDDLSSDPSFDEFAGQEPPSAADRLPSGNMPGAFASPTLPTENSSDGAAEPEPSPKKKKGGLFGKKKSKPAKNVPVWEQDDDDESFMSDEPAEDLLSDSALDELSHLDGNYTPPTPEGSEETPTFEEEPADVYNDDEEDDAGFISGVGEVKTSRLGRKKKR